MKERLDVLLVSRGLAPSREKAKTMIMEGNVFVNNNELRHFIPDGGLHLDDHDKNLIRDD